jgi:putative membrane protein
MSDSRFPKSVYGVGEEPDPRFSLANERTFLAWIRTSVALVAVGVAIEALAAPIHPPLRFVAAILFILLGLISAGYAWVSWSRTERALRLAQALPGLAIGTVLVAGLMLAAIIVVIGMLV